MSEASSPRPSPRFASFFRGRGLRRTLIGGVAFLVLFGLFGYFALPGIVKSQAEKWVARTLHRQLTIEHVRINPFTLKVDIDGLKLMEPDGAAVFLAFDALRLNLSGLSLWHLAPVVEAVALEKPYVHLVRTEANHYNIDDLVELIASQPPTETPARFAVHNIRIEAGRIEFDDRPEKTLHAVSDLQLGLPFISSLPANVDVFVEPMLSARVNDTPLKLTGRARPYAKSREASMNLTLEDMDLTRYMEYLPFEPRFKLPAAGLNVHLVASFLHPRDTVPSLKLNGEASLRGLEVTDLAGKPMIGFSALTVMLKDMDVFTGAYDIARIALEQPTVNLVRKADGTFNLAQLAPPPQLERPKPATPDQAASALVTLGEFVLTDGLLRYTDDQATRPLHASVDKFDLAVTKVAMDTTTRRIEIGEIRSNGALLSTLVGKPVARPPVAASKTMPATRTSTPGYTAVINRVALAGWSARLEDRSLARPVVTVIDPLVASFTDFSTTPGSLGKLELKARVNKAGQFAAGGTLGLTPPRADLTLDIKTLDLLPLQPYFTDQINLLVTRAALSGKGALKMELAEGGVKGGFRGNLTLGNLATIDKLSANDFLRWKSLDVGGIDLKLAPFALNIDEVALSDFFARIIIDPTGRINLQDIARAHPDEQKSLTEAAPLTATGPGSAKATASLPPPSSSSPPPPIAIRKIALQGGQVKFTDNFIKPNYNADLLQLGGVVSGLSSRADTVATAELGGQVNGAPLTIAGRLNPLKGDLFLDLKAEVKGMELAQFTPYSAKYVGYGIEKGKLSFEVAYRVDKRQLTAQNRLVLDQLNFGERMESPAATKLPVQLAVALLRDRNGVIDINLPIGGSLDDPQFSVGGIIVRVIVNLITKAITAPFALLGSLFGGGEELSWLEFDAGRATIPAAGETRLNSLAKALNERPALKLEIAGRVEAEADREGLRRANIERKVKALKLKDMVAKGESSDLETVSVKAEEYPALLKRVYKGETFAKPRNLVGMQKDLPVEEMEKLMLANARSGDEELVALANQRAQAVKEWLVKNGKVPVERIFIVAGKSGAAPEKARGSRADFSLK